MAAIDFIVHRYNYLIAIVLMMIGLYIVISRGNLVKKIVGLNIFQTSVFIYYISIGKIFGGTAPIIVGGHGDGASPAHEDAAAPSIHATPSSDIADLAANQLGATPPAQPGVPAGESVHAAPQALPGGAETNSFAVAPPHTGDGIALAPPPTGDPHFVVAPPDAGSDAAGDVVRQVAEIVYSNPLPHVLILTAIVVGVATTAVGLALAVRIREAYGTVEEDELEAADDISEFGEDYAKMQEASA